MADFFLRSKKDSNDPATFNLERTFFFGNGSNDLQVDTNGDFALVQGTDALNQNMAKILVTERGANNLFPIYGALLQELVGARLDFEFLQAKIKQELIDGLRIYQFINKDNDNLDEQIDTLDTVKIEQDTETTLSVEFSVITKTGRNVGAIIRLEA